MAPVGGWFVTLLLAGLALLLVVVFLRQVNSYWRQLGVPFVEPTLLFGNATGLFFMRESFSVVIDNVYRRLEGCPVGGFYLMTQPCLMLRDPEVIKRVNLWDERHFHPRCLAPRAGSRCCPACGRCCAPYSRCCLALPQPQRAATSSGASSGRPCGTVSATASTAMTSSSSCSRSRTGRSSHRASDLPCRTRRWTRRWRTGCWSCSWRASR